MTYDQTILCNPALILCDHAFLGSSPPSPTMLKSEVNLVWIINLCARSRSTSFLSNRIEVVPTFFPNGGIYKQGWLFFLQSNFHFCTHRREKCRFEALRTWFWFLLNFNKNWKTGNTLKNRWQNWIGKKSLGGGGGLTDIIEILKGNKEALQWALVHIVPTPLICLT